MAEDYRFYDPPLAYFKDGVRYGTGPEMIAKIDALERDVAVAFERGLRAAADEALKENKRRIELSSVRIPAMACEIHDAILKLIPGK